MCAQDHRLSTRPSCFPATFRCVHGMAGCTRMAPSFVYGPVLTVSFVPAIPRIAAGRTGQFSMRGASNRISRESSQENETDGEGRGGAGGPKGGKDRKPYSAGPLRRDRRWLLLGPKAKSWTYIPPFLDQYADSNRGNAGPRPATLLLTRSAMGSASVRADRQRLLQSCMLAMAERRYLPAGTALCDYPGRNSYRETSGAVLPHGR